MGWIWNFRIIPNHRAAKFCWRGICPWLVPSSTCGKKTGFPMFSLEKSANKNAFSWNHFQFFTLRIPSSRVTSPTFQNLWGKIIILFEDNLLIFKILLRWIPCFRLFSISLSLEKHESEIFCQNPQSPLRWWREQTRRKHRGVALQMGNIWIF